MLCICGKKKTFSEIENKFEACYDPQEAKREMKNVVVAEEREKKSEKENRRKRRVVCGREKRADVPTR